jgi:amidohydrolase
MTRAVLTLFAFIAAWPAVDANAASVESQAHALEQKLIAWRRDIHAHPELSNREFRTSKLVADHLRSLGLEVKTDIAHTGVAGFLKGGRSGPVVALRADMDALPVSEQTDLPFASKATGEYEGNTTGVMHACGHDAHTAILMATAELLSQRKDTLPGSVLFIFQPAEEGAPGDEEGGAELMLQEGLFEWKKPEVVFGLHVFSTINAGRIGYRAGPAMAASDKFDILVQGEQTHGSRPWGGVDPVTAAAQIVLGLQTVASRQVDVASAPVIISVGSIHGGIRNNIIPDSVKLVGTIRTFDDAIQADVHNRVTTTAANIASAAGATAEVKIDKGYPVTVNDPDLVAATLPSLQKVVGEQDLYEVPLVTGAEDFSYFAQRVPGFYFFLGATPRGQDPAKAPSNHSPKFFLDESTLVVGLEALTTVALDYMERGAAR